LQEASKSDGEWSTDYRSYWGSFIKQKVRGLEGFPDLPGVGESFDTIKARQVLEANRDSLIKWQQEARDFANSANLLKGTGSRLEPGTPEFDSVFNSIISKQSYAEGGTKFYDKSALYHAQAEYKFTPTWLDITVGGNFRMYVPNSNGTIFKDTAGIRITNYEFGFYAGLEKKFMENKFKANLTARIDKNQNFPVLVSPAASLVYSPTKEHTLRLSFSAAIRNPTLQDQYLYYNVGRAILIGNLNGFDSLVTVESFQDVYSGITPDLNKLSYFNVDPVVPEKVKTIEVGYRATLFKKIFVDLGYYFSFYKDFIGYNIGLQVPVDSLTGINLSEVQGYRVASNAKSQVTTQGFSIGVNYFFYKFLAFNANYSWNKLNKSGADDPLIPAFNTPEHKFNVGISGREIVFNANKPALNNWGFSVNYKWVQSFVFEGSPQFTGTVPTYDLLDVQINKAIPKIYTTFKLGAQNVINNKHIEVYGGPYVGRLVYASILFEFDKIK
jgi:outer membrane receptor protein involved in Fe transport